MTTPRNRVRGGRARPGGMAMLAAAGLAAMMIAGPAGPAAATAAPGLFGWGENTYGEVGTGTLATQARPAPVGLPAAPAQIAENASNSAAVLANGTVATWGNDFYGQLGDGQASGARPAPFVVPGLPAIVQVAIGFDHMLALDSAGTVWSWGNNYYGELGNGSTSAAPGIPVPARVPGLSGVTQIAAGNGYSLARTVSGTVWAWGHNTYGQLGDGSTTDASHPRQVPGLTTITKVAASWQTSYAVTTDGTLLAWGDNSGGLLGKGTSSGYFASPGPVPGITGVSSVAPGYAETLAIAGPGSSLWAWGANAYGQAGDGTTTAHYSPEQTSLAGVQQIASGMYMSAARVTGGKLLTWGSAGNGRLGHPGGSTPVPTLVPSLAGVTQVALGFVSGLAEGSAAPQVPSVIGDLQSTATAELQAAGFTVGRVTTVVDLTCEYIGVVKSQSPAAGTVAQPGTSVNLTIGKAGGKCLGD